MVVLVAREAVVDDENRAVLEAPAEAAHPSARGEVDLAFVGNRRPRARARRPAVLHWRAFRPMQGRWSTPRSIMPASTPGDRMDRNRVGHLVGDDHAAKVLGQADRGTCTRSRRAASRLTRPQGRTGFEDEVFALDFARGASRRARRCRRRARGSARRARCSWRASVRPKSEPSSGAVTKSPLGAELARAARVVAEAGRVQRELHVAREGDPAAGGVDLGARCVRRARASAPRIYGLHGFMDGRVALVTGGARRVGAAITRALHAAGAEVLIHYRDSDADAAKLEAELNAVRARSAAEVKAELLAPIAPRRAGQRRDGELRPPRRAGEQRLQLLSGREWARSSRRNGKS